MQPTPISCPTCGALAHPPRYTDLDASAKVCFLVGMGVTFFAGLMLYFGLAVATGWLQW